MDSNVPLNHLRYRSMQLETTLHKDFRYSSDMAFYRNHPCHSIRNLLSANLCIHDSANKYNGDGLQLPQVLDQTFRVCQLNHNLQDVYSAGVTLVGVPDAANHKPSSQPDNRQL